MEAYPKLVTLKKGVELTVRPMVPTDEAALQAFFADLPLEDRQFLKEDVSNPAVIRRWCEELDYTNVLPILALTEEGQVAGNGTLHAHRYPWSKHVGEIRCVVAREWQHKGVGVVLCRELVANAQHGSFEKIVAKMAEDQDAARTVFERLGFHVEAVLKDHIVDLQGRKRNMVIMSSHLPKLSQQLEELYRSMDLSMKHQWG